MGCGASKTVAVVNAPAPAPAVARSASTTSLAPAAKAAIVTPESKPAVIVVAAAAPAPEPQPAIVPEVRSKPADEVVSAAPSVERVNEIEKMDNNAGSEPDSPVKKGSTDSGCESLEDLSAEKEIADLDLAVKGTRISSRIRSAITAANEVCGDAEDEVMNTSAVIAERPSSRGGLAFDMTFEGEQSRVRVPARLEKIRTRTRSSELSIEELQQKLAAADARRLAVEQKLKDKMGKETEKIEKVQQAATVVPEVSKAADKENKVLENREANLRAIRDKLKAREEHARKVRDNKRLSANAADLAAAAAAPPITA